MYIMTLADGTEIEFAGLNGTNLIVPDKNNMDVSVFTDENLKICKFTDDEGNATEVLNLAFIQQQRQADGDCYICFREKSQQEIFISEIEDLLVQVAEIEVESGALELDDINGSLKDAVRVKVDQGKRMDL